MNKNWVIAILAVVIILLCCYFFSKPTIPISDSTEYIEKIDSLESEIDSLYKVRDSITEVIDTVYVKLNDINQKHEETVNTIINNTSSEDYCFFINYINRNRSRLDSMYNSNRP